jgi:hypothetical protein
MSVKSGATAIRSATTPMAASAALAWKGERVLFFIVYTCQNGGFRCVCVEGWESTCIWRVHMSKWGLSLRVRMRGRVRGYVSLLCTYVKMAASAAHVWKGERVLFFIVYTCQNGGFRCACVKGWESTLLCCAHMSKWRLSLRMRERVREYISLLCTHVKMGALAASANAWKDERVRFFVVYTC